MNPQHLFPSLYQGDDETADSLGIRRDIRQRARGFAIMFTHAACSPSSSAVQPPSHISPEVVFAKFLALAPEIRHSIMEQLDCGNILSIGIFFASAALPVFTYFAVAKTSREMYNCALPLLYRHVDISCHNDAGLFLDWRRDRTVENNYPDRYRSEYERNGLQTRQKAFVRAILMTPSRGALVYSLTWTYDLYYVDYDRTYEAQQEMWRAFALLSRVRRLDMCSFDREEFAVVPPPLFPTASSIRIGGKMSYAFFRSVVSSPENVVFLDLDNPQGFGQWKDGLLDEDEVSITYMNNLGSYPETVDANKIPLVRHPGAMRGHLEPLLGRFTKLKHLYLRTVGQDDCATWRWSEARDMERYAEIANFITSVSSTLISLTFEQGIEAEENIQTRNCRQSPRPRQQIGRPMDTYFLSYISPTLVNGPWPNLRTLILRGIGGRRSKLPFGSGAGWIAEDHGVFESAEDRLRVALGEGVEFKWEKEVGRSFYLQHGIDYSDPHAPYP